MTNATYRPDLNPRAYSTADLEKRKHRLEVLERDPKAKDSTQRVQELNIIRSELANRTANTRSVAGRKTTTPRKETTSC